uniref:Pleiotropic drug resistance protein 1 n=1 Tax=Rhizophora mucronata TaxID=61149 RepID=A0A2P2IUY2_RHIMU
MFRFSKRTSIVGISMPTLFTRFLSLSKNFSLSSSATFTSLSSKFFLSCHPSFFTSISTAPCLDPLNNMPFLRRS